MQVINIVWGFLSVIGMIIAFFPCLGALNWIVVPFSAVGFILSFITVVLSSERRPGSLIGIALCGIAVAVGLLRLGLGFGIL